jgi:hypothetical protein
MLLIVKERNYLTDSGDRGNKGAGELPVPSPGFVPSSSYLGIISRISWRPASLGRLLFLRSAFGKLHGWQ